jgi:hypothetical protein
MLILIICNTVWAQEIIFSNFPARLQLYARDEQDSALAPIRGTVVTPGYSTISLQVYRNEQLWKQYQSSLDYSGGNAGFEFLPKIHAERSEFHFRVLLDGILKAQQDSIVCGDVYLINGQSNSHPDAPEATFRSEFCRSFGQHTNTDAYNPADTTWGLSTARGWANLPYAVGAWGLRLQEWILSNYGIPTCIINGGSGGSSIEYNLPDSADHQNLNTTYGRLLYRASKAGVAGHVKALFWHQGEADSYTNLAEIYLSQFTRLYDAWRQDYHPLTKIYLFQIHPGCGGDKQDYLREVQRKFPQSFPDIEMMSTLGLIGHDGCHYNYAGYTQMAEWIWRLLIRDFYGSNDTEQITPPNILRAAFTGPEQNRIALDFDQPVVWPDDTLGYSLKDFFYLDGFRELVSSGYTGVAEPNRIYLELYNASSASVITYLPNATYYGQYHYYEGPWIRNPRGVGALSFYEFPVEQFVSGMEREAPQNFKLHQNYPNPFNPSTAISFELQQSARVRIDIVNIYGQVIKILLSKKLTVGFHTVNWKGDRDDGGAAPAGQYFYRLFTDGTCQVRKAVLIK